MTSSYGRGLGCDGVFLDTLDTAAPNSYTNPASSNETKFEWTAPGFGDFIRKVHDNYQDKLILQNRGLFFFDPRHPAYDYNARGAIDFVLYESYRLDSSDAELWNPTFYPDNQFNVAPKLMAEANRADGFRVLSLGYAEGPADQMSPLTLPGQSTLGSDDLLEDIRVTQQLAGFRHYLTNAKVDLVNDFVLTHDALDDHDPPQWTSTYNDHQQYPAVAPTPRVGIQQAVVARREGHRALGRRHGREPGPVRSLRPAAAVRFHRGSGVVGGDPDAAHADRPLGLPGGRRARQLPLRGCPLQLSTRAAPVPADSRRRPVAQRQRGHQYGGALRDALNPAPRSGRT